MYATGDHTLKEVAEALSLNYWTLRRNLQRRGVNTNMNVAILRSAKKRTGTRYTHCGMCGTEDKARGQWCDTCGASRRRWQHLDNTYGLSADQYFALLRKQDGACAYCKREVDYALRVDHCHETGRVRGLLCIQCNGSLGQLGDNEAGLLRALAYVRGEL